MTEIIKPSKYHRTIDGVALAAAREEKGLTQAKFAELAEWSQQFQAQLEAPGEHEIRLQAAEKIYEIFSECQ